MTREALRSAAGPAFDAAAAVTRRYVAAAGAVAALGAAWCVAYLTVGAGTEAIAYVFAPLGGVFATASVVHLVRAGDLGRVATRFWRTVLIAVAVISFGYAWLAVDMLAHFAEAHTRTMPIPAAACVAAGFGTAIWAVARVPVVATGGVDRWRMLLDRTIAFLGCSAVLWYLVLAPMLSAAEPWSRQAMVLVGLAFLVAVGAATKVSYIAGGPVDRTAIRLVAASGGVIAGIVAVLAVRFGYAASVPAQALVMPLAPVLITVAVAVQRRGERAAARGGVLLPYLAVAAVDLPLLAVAFGAPLHWPGRVVLITAVVVTVLVTLRQYIAFQENAQLLHNTRVQEERLQYEVSHDALTGLANRALFRGRLTTALARTGRAVVLLVDLDDFKTVNDLLGHGVGDELLVSVARLLHAEVGDAGLAVRVGGDEFAVLLTDAATDPEELAGRLLAALNQPISEHRLLVQASIGIATAEPGTHPAATVDSVLRNADVAMYTAKQRGKASYVRYVDGMGEPVLAHMQLGGELRRALDEGELRVVYQPILRLDDHRITGVEALVRWDHPTRGAVAPAEFIPAAERTGLIVPLGRFVLRETCHQAAAWLAEFGPDALPETALNVSARQLHDPDFVTDVKAALADSGLPCERLVLEVTESAVLRGQQVSRTLYELDRMGIRLALDDFGTGESSLSLLRAFPAAIVKLDKSFVDGIEIDDGQPAAADARQAVARAVIQLARALALDTVAEGVESAEQVVVLRELGYTLGQGYHLARPMSAGGVSRLLARQQSMAAADR